MSRRGDNTNVGRGPVQHPKADGAGERRIKVAYITQWFAPEPHSVPLWIATSLRRQGMQVEVVTGVPNYPTGKTFPGYSAWRRSHDLIDGFGILRTPIYPSHGRSALGRIANLASYSLSSTIFGQRTLKNADVALVHSSPATAAVAAMYANKRSGTPYLLQILDMWPDTVFASGFLKSGLVRRIAEKSLHRFVAKAYAGAAHIGVTSPGMRDLLIERGVSREKISIIYNWVDEQVMRPSRPEHSIRQQLGLDGQFILMYAGNHGSAQRLDVALKAMERLRDLRDVHLVMVGDGYEKSALEKLAAELDLPNVHFFDQVAPSEVPGLMASADLQLVALADEELFKITMPSKLQSIMACAQPILLSANGDAARVVEEAGAGFTCRPGDSEALAGTVRAARKVSHGVLEAMGRSGHRYYHAHLGEAVNSRALADALTSAAREPRR